MTNGKYHFKLIILHITMKPPHFFSTSSPILSVDAGYCSDTGTKQ